MTASSSPLPSTKPLPVSAATLPRGSPPTAHPICRSRRTFTMSRPSRPATACLPFQTYFQSPSERHEMPTTRAALATRRTPTCSTQCSRPASRLRSSPSPRPHPGPVSTSRPRRLSSKCRAAERTCCPAWFTMVATNRLRPRRPCPARTPLHHTRHALNPTGAAAPEDAAATSTSTTTEPLR